MLLLSLFVLSRYPFISLLERSRVGDDLLYVSVADNLRKGNGLASDILIWRQILAKTPTGETTYRYEEWEEVSHLIHNVGPIYPLFLAAVFIVSSAHSPSWYIVAVLANSAVAILVIAAIYLFALRIFDRKTALLASIAAALLPSLYWYSMQARPLPLFFLLVIFAFIAASRASGVKGWLLVGALAAVAHLTHGLGILIIATFLLWCLIERRFKDSLFLMIPYVGLMLPWMIRNQLIFGDFTLGTAIPATTILGLFGIKYGYISSQGVSTTSNFSVLQVLFNMHNDLTQRYNMEYVPLLLFFAICGLYWYRNRRVLVPQFIFLILSLLGYLCIAFVTNRATPETRYLMGSFLVLLPLSMYGFINIVFASFSKVSIWLTKQGMEVSPTLLTNIARTGIILLLLGGMVISLVDFAADLDETNKTYAETSEELQLHELLRQRQLPETTVLLTNNPYITYLYTGMESLYLRSEEANVTQIEWLIVRYDVDYIVIYCYQNHPPEARSQLNLLARNPGITVIYSAPSIRLYEVTDFVVGYIPPLGLPELYDADTAILFNEMGGAIANDLSYNDHAATLINTPSWGTQGRVHKIILNGIDQYATLPSMSMTGDRTYIVVVSPDFLESEDAARYIFAFRVSATNCVQIGKLDNAGGNLIAFQQRGEGVSGKQAGVLAGFAQNDTIVIVCTYDDTTKVGTLYINGTARDTFTGGANPIGSAALQLGRYNESFGGY